MTKVVGISFKDVGKIYWFSPNVYDLHVGDKVVVEVDEFQTIVEEVIFKLSSNRGLNLTTLLCGFLFSVRARDRRQCCPKGSESQNPLLCS